MQRCKQNLTQTLSVIEYVCQQIKTDFPNIKNAYKKSHNAGCYSSNGYIVGEYHILKEKGVTLIQDNFNEPQREKD